MNDYPNNQSSEDRALWERFRENKTARREIEAERADLEVRNRHLIDAEKALFKYKVLRMREQYDSGMTPSEIARYWHRTEPAVQHALRKLAAGYYNSYPDLDPMDPLKTGLPRPADSANTAIPNIPLFMAP